ncbi:MAG: plastocyanin/azurin family copper-binding protein [Variibacter sp.]
MGQLHGPKFSARWVTALLALAFGVGGGLAGVALAATTFKVTQRGRAFQPAEISIKQGDTVQFINDDGDLLHHAYLNSEKFTFDTGDQEPGSKSDVVFTAKGDFVVLCGIHPKMKLTVHVK